MSLPLKKLEELEKEGEHLGIYKKFNSKNEYYMCSILETKKFILSDRKIHATLLDKEHMKFGHFKSKYGYNSKYKFNEDNGYPNHYAEYIAYIILKQLGKPCCKVELGELEIEHRYSNKKVKVEGCLSYFELTPEENLKTLSELIESYKIECPEEYKEICGKSKEHFQYSYANIEVILRILEELYRKNSQEYKIPQMHKQFFDMCIFDLMFTNRDRNDENFGIKINQLTNEFDFYPLFDNEQILGMQENKQNIKKYISSEREYEKFKKNNLTSYIRIPGKTKGMAHTKFLRYLLENYYNETINSLEDIGRYTISNLQEVLNICPDLPEEHKTFAKKIFLDRKKEIENEVKNFKQKKEECQK